jgi:hypothetical protein
METVISAILSKTHMEEKEEVCVKHQHLIHIHVKVAVTVNVVVIITIYFSVSLILFYSFVGTEV